MSEHLAIARRTQALAVQRDRELEDVVRRQGCSLHAAALRRLARRWSDLADNRTDDRLPPSSELHAMAAAAVALANEYDAASLSRST